MLQGQQDVLEELLRDRFLLGEVTDEDRAGAVLASEQNHGFQSVLALARQHETHKLYRISRVFVKHWQRLQSRRIFMRLSRDWWAVLAAAALVLLIKLGVVTRVPW